MAKKQHSSGDTTVNPTKFILLILAIAFCIVLPILILVFFSLLVLYAFIKYQMAYTTKKTFGFLGNEEDFMGYILALSAYLTQTENQISETEKQYIRKQLEKDFEEHLALRYMDLYESYLEKDIQIKAVASTINLKFKLSSKIQLLHFLVGLIAADGVLTKAEEHKIFTIARLIRVPYSSLRSILAMFSFKQERNSSAGQQNSSGNSGSTRSNNNLTKAYAILGVSADASAEKIKRAYRKLAMIHHPDKVAHLGEQYQNKAKAKFQKIVDAYNVIKEKRGIV